MSRFAPLLAGASLRDRAMACLGAFAGVALTTLLCGPLLNHFGYLALLAPPFGASAVLLFAVPSSPMAQPWPIIGGSTVSAMTGIAMHQLIGPTPLAAGCAVAGAILFMTLLRCLHAPGGAVAMIGVIGGPAVAAAGFPFAFAPIALNATLLVTLGWCFHRFSGHSYPHRPAALGVAAQGLTREDVDNALADMGETFDISHEDLDLLLQRAEAHAQVRRKS